MSESDKYHNLNSFFLKIDVHHSLDLELLKISECKKFCFVIVEEEKFSFTFLGPAAGT